MTKRFLTTVVLALGMLASEAMATRGVVVVRTPPPRARSLRPVGRRPGPRYVWTSGFWGPSRGRARYTWMPGRWVVPPRRGAVWVSPRWRRSRGGYTFVAGRWR